ncbi:MAG: 30S ribosomal protein S16 [Myxococcota bacterium]
MVRIRLFRTGTTKRPSYRIVVVDGRCQRQGRVLQRLGTYEPRRDGAVTLDPSALEHWLSRGAQMSDTVRSLVRRWRREGVQAQAEPAQAEPVAPAGGDAPAAG